MLIDTHCHIHEAVVDVDDSALMQSMWAKSDDMSVDQIIQRAHGASVTKMICVGTTLSDSRRAIEVANQHDGLWASIGLHPHEAAKYVDDDHALQQFRDLASKPKVVAVGEIGLDYHYNNSPKDAQKRLLKFQIDVAVEHNLPLIFHVRDAFDDFWTIFDSYEGLRGVLHSYTDNVANMHKGLERGLYIGVNGIATFNKDEELREAHRTVPTDRVLFETDAPFLTPAPFRGTICEPKHVRVTAEFLANLQSKPFGELAQASTHNATVLFNLE